jgi:hypothetical protein
MTLPTAFRPLQPTLAAQPSTAAHPQPRVPLAAAAAPMSPPLQLQAPAQPGTAAASLALRLAERDERSHPAAAARAAAEDARAAYIKASRAAGVSPLPLPGV